MAFQVLTADGQGTRQLRPDELTVDDVLKLGLDAVNGRLPQALLVQMSRMFVKQQLHTRSRAKARAMERRAFGEATDFSADQLDEVILQASLAAARQAVVNWEPLLMVPFALPESERITTWGAADVDEHSERAQWLEHQAAGNLRTAVSHRAAILAIGAARTSNLLQVVARRG